MKTKNKTILFFLLAMTLNGIISSASNTYDIIGKKALDGLDWQITILTMLFSVSNFVSIWWGRLISFSKNKSKFFLLIGILGRLPLLAGFFIQNIYHLMFFLVIFFTFNSMQNPLINSLLQSNLDRKVRGKIFGYGSSISTFVALIITYSFGKILDVNEFAFHYYYVITAVMAFMMAFILYKIEFINPKKPLPKEKMSFKSIFITPITHSFSLLKEDKEFRSFETYFMIYGLGFIILLPVIPKFLVQTLEMEYSTSFLAKGVISHLGILLFAPIAGKIHDSKHPFQFISLCFVTLSLYPLTLFISSFLERSLAINFVFVAYTFFGIAMSGIIISWNLSSIHFAKQNDSSIYQSIHVTLTGVRGFLVPLLSLIVMKLFSIKAVFLISLTALLVASFLSYKHYRKNLKEA